MNKQKRVLIIALLTKLGYTVTELERSTRLDHYYTVSKDGIEFSLLLNKDIVYFFIMEDNKTICSYGLLLGDGGNVAHGKTHSTYKTLVDLSWDMRDLLNLQVPTIIL